MKKDIADDALLSMIAQVAPEVRVMTACRDEEIYSDDPADHEFFDDERVERILRGGGICRPNVMARSTPFLGFPGTVLGLIGAFGCKLTACGVAASIMLLIGLSSVYQSLEVGRYNNGKFSKRTTSALANVPVDAYKPEKAVIPSNTKALENRVKELEQKVAELTSGRVQELEQKLAALASDRAQKPEQKVELVEIVSERLESKPNLLLIGTSERPEEHKLKIKEEAGKRTNPDFVEINREKRGDVWVTTYKFKDKSTVPSAQADQASRQQSLFRGLPTGWGGGWGVGGLGNGWHSQPNIAKSLPPSASSGTKAPG
jgi:hypothetical protein